MVASEETSDCELIAAARRGERNALDAFVRRHEGWVRHVVYATLGHPIIVDDVVQRVWINVCRQLGTISDLNRWRPWLFRLARNAAIDAGLKRSRERKRQTGLAENDPPSNRPDDPVWMLIGNEEYQRMLDAIHGLPEIYREPFVLRHLEDWSYAQIAETMGIPVDTVETRLVRARRLLRSTLVDPRARVG